MEVFFFGQCPATGQKICNICLSFQIEGLGTYPLGPIRYSSYHHHQSRPDVVYNKGTVGKKEDHGKSKQSIMNEAGRQR